MVPSLRRALQTAFPSSGIRPGLWQSLLLSPPIFGTWFALRRLWWSATYRRRLFATEAIKTDTAEMASFALKHNLKQRWRINRTRTERLLAIARLAMPEAVKGRVLVIGPRNEAELLLMRAYGFTADQITAIDLISLSPNIELADMHALPFPDNSFDLCYACFVLSYTDRPDQAMREVHRVLRPGGVFLTGYVTPDTQRRNLAERRLATGLAAFREMLPQGIGEVYLNLTDREQTGDLFYLAFAVRKELVPAWRALRGQGRAS